jgi:hypothetical protein
LIEGGGREGGGISRVLLNRHIQYEELRVKQQCVHRILSGGSYDGYEARGISVNFIDAPYLDRCS